MNKQEALIILNDLKKQTTDEREDFITIWRNYEARSIIWCNDVNEAIEEINKLDSKNNIIAIQVNDFFMGNMKDWNSDIYD